ncbi:MAG: hypothetical protein H0W53_03025 [Acidobacteria bacterium]|nr:hypothetical protein [Acidobacteriota bacterium]
MAEVLVRYSDRITGSDGVTYSAQACGREMTDGRWEGWFEFLSLDGASILRSPRETTQPNRTDTEYWATGISPVYLEGALERCLDPLVVPPVQPEPTPAFDGPLPHGSPQTAPRPDSVLNPFSVYRNGEDLLRRQLGALAEWHLVNIIEAYELSELSAESLNPMSQADLIELIVARVRASDEVLEK